MLGNTRAFLAQVQNSEVARQTNRDAVPDCQSRQSGRCTRKILASFLSWMAAASYPFRQNLNLRHVQIRMPYLCLMILIGQSAILTSNAWQASPNCDELAHLASGLYHWQTGNFHAYQVNPPLIRLWCSMPLALSRPTIPWHSPAATKSKRPEWQLARLLLQSRNPQQIRFDLLAARLMCIPLVCLGSVTCYLWSRHNYGVSPGLAAMLLWAFSPNICSWGATLCPDVPAAAIGALACFNISAWFNRPTVLNATIVGTLLGFALLAKTTWIILVGLLPIMVVGHLCLVQTGRNHASRILLQSVYASLTGLLVLNAGYGFQDTFSCLNEFDFHSEIFRSYVNSIKSFHKTSLTSLPIPLPQAFIEGIDLQQFEFERGKRSFLCGQWKDGGWWYYYVLAALVKMPIGFWILTIVSAWYPAPARLTKTPHLTVPSTHSSLLAMLLPFAAMAALISSQTGFSRHLRYAFPCFPFCYIWVSQTAVWTKTNTRLRYIVSLALISFVIGSLLCWPFQHSYFNLLAGGPLGGHRFLLDANIDWGEDVLHAERWAKDHPTCRPLYRAFVSDEFAAHRQFHWNRASQLRTGWYLVSIHRLLDPTDSFSCFQRLRPVDRIGFSTLVYKIQSKEAALTADTEQEFQRSLVAAASR